MRIAYDKIDALNPRNFFWCALGVTTRDDDARPRIRAMNLAHRFPRLRICRSGHGTGIQHYDIGVRMFVNKRKPAREEIAPQSRGIRVRSATAEIFNRKCSHAVNYNLCAK